MATIDPYSLEDAERDIATLAGPVDRLTEVLRKTHPTTPPTNPAAGLIHYSLAGHHKYASADGSDFNTGRLTLSNTAPQTINPAAVTPITGLTCPVAANTTYEFDGILRIKQGAANVNQNIGFTSPAATNVV